MPEARSGGARAPYERSEERVALFARVEAELAQLGLPLHPRVLAALQVVPRHRFVPPAASARAYEDVPLAIGHEQTISQPFVVALMTDLLRVKPRDRVLEVGTGCGYQTAILARLARQVCSIERIPELSHAAEARLCELGCDNALLRSGDGALGWVERAPFAAIVVTAAAPEVPPALLEQLAPGGRLVAPIGVRGAQHLQLLERDAAGVLTRRELLPVAFVPLRSPTLDSTD
jgi:protein-L-isoaspartate(D-aspartate) O-methyltransferase